MPHREPLQFQGLRRQGATGRWVSIGCTWSLHSWPSRLPQWLPGCINCTCAQSNLQSKQNLSLLYLILIIEIIPAAFEIGALEDAVTCFLRPPITRQDLCLVASVALCVRKARLAGEGTRVEWKLTFGATYAHLVLDDLASDAWTEADREIKV